MCGIFNVHNCNWSCYLQKFTMYYQQNIFLFHQLHFIAVALLDYHKHYRNLHLTKGQYHITQWSRKLFHMHMTMWLLIWGGECSPSCVKHRRQKMVMKSGILLGHLLVLSWLHEAYPGTSISHSANIWKPLYVQLPYSWFQPQ